MISGAAMALAAFTRSSSGRLLGTHRGAPPPARAYTALPRMAVSDDRFAVDPDLLRRALNALNTHHGMIIARDRMAIVDFTAPSSDPRMHLLDVVSGKAIRLRVAHGSGSDPEHTGYLKSFSNAVGSNASSEGAFLADDFYVGKHGRSQRLIGLDPTNNNALERAIVVHSAWYANDDMITQHGMLGRSEGCFAVAENRLEDVFSFLGKGRMIYAARA